MQGNGNEGNEGNEGKSEEVKRKKILRGRVNGKKIRFIKY